MTVSVPHSLGSSVAKGKIDKFAENLKNRFPGEAQSLSQSWNGNTASVVGKIKGFNVDFKLSVSESSVVADGKLPLLAKPFQGKIEAAVKDGIEKALMA